MPIDYSHEHFSTSIIQPNNPHTPIDPTGGGVSVDNGTDPPAAVTTLVAPGAVIAGDSATLVANRLVGPLAVAWDTAVDGDGYSARLATIPAGTWIVYGGIVIKPGDAWVSTGFSSGLIIIAADPAVAVTNVKPISDLSALPDIADITYLGSDAAPNPNAAYFTVVDVGVYWNPHDDPATAGSLDIFLFTAS